MTVSRTLILGGSRGLGRALAGQISDSISVSRTGENPIDLSKSTSAPQEVLELINRTKPCRIIYSAGGGPHGEFFEKNMKSHMWAFNLNFFTPIQILYGLIEQNYKGEFIYVGSAIAQRSQSTQSLSYAESKKMATRAVLSLQSKLMKTKVFSPGYMDTDLLPKGAWPRTECPNLVVAPSRVASLLLNWADGQNGNDDSRHFDWIDTFDYALPIDKDL